VQAFPLDSAEKKAAGNRGPGKAKCTKFQYTNCRKIGDIFMLHQNMITTKDLEPLSAKEAITISSKQTDLTLNQERKH
jgi:hypothetical protein